MKVFTRIEDFRTWKKTLSETKRLGFVPTMGALHEGHATLIRKARDESDYCVVSIFVNPTQFGPNEDFHKYPRPFSEDVAMCTSIGVDAIFAPNVEELYPKPTFLRFSIDSLAKHLCGAHRSGHFEGVLQVVSKLFHIVEPDLALFGQKDIQQGRILELLVEELNFPIEIQLVPTVRERDGLAMSSRNRYLSKEERSVAPELYLALTHISEQVQQLQPLSDVLAYVESSLVSKGFKIDYLSIVNYDTLQPVTSLNSVSKVIIAGAVYLGTTRLIDNLIVPIR